MVDMKDPQIQSYKRSMYRSEVEDYGTMNLHENLFSYGVYLTDRNTEEPLTFPEGFGRFVTTIEGSEPSSSQQPTKPCSEVFTDLNQELSTKEMAAVANGLCADPTLAAVKGSVTL